MPDSTPVIIQRFMVYAPLVLFVAVLALITATAWWRGAPDMSSAGTAVGAGVLGLIINPQHASMKAFNYLRFGLILATTGVCVVTGLSLLLHAHGDPNALKTIAAAVVAALAALAGLVIDLSKLTPALPQA